METEDFRRWVCDACGYIYDEAKGDPDSGLAPGTRYEQIPEDWQCPLCGLRKSDLRVLPEMAPAAALRPSAARFGKKSAAKSKGGADYLVIVGAGIGGWSVAEAVRAREPERPILLVTSCEGISYPKPALSTALAHGKSAGDLAEQDAETKAAGLGIEVRTETRVLKIDTSKKRITTAKGGINYGQLVLAMGAQQRALPIGGDAADQVLRVNDLAAYRRLRQRLDDGVKHVTILGAGLIGCEFAEDLSTAGYEVSVVDPTDYPLASLLPQETGQQLRDSLQRKGVSWVFHATADRVEQSGDRLRMTLSDGDAFETDLVLSAAGLVANTQLAEKAGLAVSRGIMTDRLMQTSQADVFAIGDCAAVEGQVFAYIEPIRRQAATIAAKLVGEDLPFDIKPPLVRIKTPSLPLTVCPPSEDAQPALTAQADAAAGRVDFRSGDRLVGFVLSGAEANNGMQLYRELYA